MFERVLIVIKKKIFKGIIDYIRTFTWDKKLEMIIKSTGILGGRGKTPTIIYPKYYQKRFIEAMDTYFIQVPDYWYKFGASAPISSADPKEE